MRKEKQRMSVVEEGRQKNFWMLYILCLLTSSSSSDDLEQITCDTHCSDLATSTCTLNH
jgi:hypothetical protein